MDNESGPGSQPRIREVFLSFLRLGCVSFGGPTMVAYIGDLAVRKKKWLSEESFKNGVALCQSIPGATAIQTAGYAGLRAGGPAGGLAAFVGFGLPAFIIMVVLSGLYTRTREMPVVISAFHGLQLIVIALMANATITFGKSALKGWRDALIAAAAAVFLWNHGNPIVAVVCACALGLLLHRGSRYQVQSQPGHENASFTEYRRFGIGYLVAIAAMLLLLFFLEPVLFNLCSLMMKVDFFAFGGGFASIPLMMHEVVDKCGWLGRNVFMDGIALGQVTPGPIVITATFVGYQVHGFLGALFAQIGMFAPSFFVVMAAVPFLDRLRSSVLFNHALRGILASFVGLLLSVTVGFGVEPHWSVAAIALTAAAFVALRLKVDILWVVLVGATLAVFLL